MSYQLSPSADRGAGFPSGRVMPQGEEVASFATYAEAQHAVDSLSDEGFPVQYLAIIGTDLRQVENITGRMSWGRAVASGVGSGLWIGLFFGAMLSFLGPSSNGGAVSFAAAVIMGVVWGVLFQVIAYALTRGRRDFTSTSSVVASRYSIIAAREARAAAQSLAATPGNLSRGGEAARAAQEEFRARFSKRSFRELDLPVVDLSLDSGSLLEALRAEWLSGRSRADIRRVAKQGGLRFVDDDNREFHIDEDSLRGPVRNVLAQSPFPPVYLRVGKRIARIAR